MVPRRTTERSAVDDAWLKRHLGSTGADPGVVAARVRREPRRVATLLKGIEADSAPVRFGSSKVLRVLSETAPALLYGHFDFFVKQWRAKNQILAWDAARVIANLAAVDDAGKIDGLLEQYLSAIDGPRMITAATAMAGAATIAIAKPQLAGRIAAAILRVERANYATAECRNVAIGHAIEALGSVFPLFQDRICVIAFVAAQRDNSRAGVRRKAERFLKKWQS